MNTDHSSRLLKGKFGPTVIQVAAGVYSGLLWSIKNPNAGCRWPEDLPTEPIIEIAKPYLGSFVSSYVDLK